MTRATKILLPRDLRAALDSLDEDHRTVLARIVLAVTLRVSALILVPVLLAIGLTVYEGKQRTESINASRAEITYTSCVEQNDRHDRTIDQLDKIIATRKAEIRQAIKRADSIDEAEALRAQIDTADGSKATTISLIDALVPLRGCDQLVLDRFGFLPEVAKRDVP